MSKNTIKDSELRSAGVQNLLDKNPRWFILKGNFIISFILLILLSIICYFVKYPEFINSKVSISPSKINNHNQIIVGQLSLSENSDLAKIKNGQNVIVKLYDYPYQEFGVLEGKVQQVPTNSKRNHIDVIFSNSLKTSYNKNITFNKELKGNAEIVTRELTLIEKFFSQF